MSAGGASVLMRRVAPSVKHGTAIVATVPATGAATVVASLAAVTKVQTAVGEAYIGESVGVQQVIDVSTGNVVAPAAHCHSPLAIVICESPMAIPVVDDDRMRHWKNRINTRYLK